MKIGIPLALPSDDNQYSIAMYHAGIEVGRELAQEHALAEAVKQLADSINAAVALYMAGRKGGLS